MNAAAASVSLPAWHV